VLKRIQVKSETNQSKAIRGNEEKQKGKHVRIRLRNHSERKQIQENARKDQTK